LRTKDQLLKFSQIDEVVKTTRFDKNATKTPQRVIKGYLKTIKPIEGLTGVIQELAIKCSKIYVHSIRLLYFQIIRCIERGEIGD